MDLNHENITFVRHNLEYFKTDKVDFTKLGGSYIELTKFLIYNLYKFTGDFYNVPEIAKLYKEKQKFDIVMVDFFTNEVSSI